MGEHVRGQPLRSRVIPPFALALILASIASLAFANGQAEAAIRHQLLSQITEAPTGVQLEEPVAVATDQAANRIFVVDARIGGPVVDVLNSAGVFQTQFGSAGEKPTAIAVDEISGDVYVAENEFSGGSVIDVFRPNGSGGYTIIAEWTGAQTARKGFTEIVGLAVDSSTGSASHTVYALDSNSANTVALDVFTPPGSNGKESAPSEAFSSAEVAEATSIAVNAPTGNVYIGAKEAVVEYDSTGKELKHLGGAGVPTAEKNLGLVTSVAVDPTNEHVYAAVEPFEVQLGSESQTVVQELEPKGKWIGWIRTTSHGQLFELGSLGNGREGVSLAVASTGHLYVGDGSRTAKAIYEYGIDATVPDVKTGKTTEVTRTSGIMSGTINPNGEAATYHFEWGTTEAFGHSTAIESAGNGTLPVTVTEPIEGLNPQTKYYYRIVGESANGANFGLLDDENKLEGEVGFETEPAVFGLLTIGAVPVEPTSATLTGSLKPEGIATEYRFEYGETEAYGKVTETTKTNTTKKVSASIPVTGLNPNTTYHFRLVATNEFGTTFGLDTQFTTPGPPRIVDKPVEAVGDTSATLHSELNPDQRATTYHYEYGETTAYGKSAPVPDKSAGEGGSFVQVEVPISELKLATTYHFRLVATNAAGTTTGPDETFTTALIESEAATEVTSTSATLEAGLNPPSLETTYHFEYGKTTAYGTTTPVPDKSIGSTPGTQVVTTGLTGLEPETTYHYRVVASVTGLTPADGPDRTFTTNGSEAVAALPDGRAYEMVTPPDKHGAVIEAMKEKGVIEAAENGDALAFGTDGPIAENPEGNRSPEFQQALGTRGVHEWEVQDLATPNQKAYGIGSQPIEYRLFSPDLSLSAVEPVSFGSGATRLAEPPLAPPVKPGEVQEKTIYERASAGVTPGKDERPVYTEATANGKTFAAEHGLAEAPGFLAMITAANTPEGAQFGGELINGGGGAKSAFEPGLEFEGATEDLNYSVVRSTHAKLSSISEATGPGLYRWDSESETLQPVSLLPGNKTFLGGRAAVFGGKTPSGFTFRSFRHAISSDGSRVFWTDNEHGSHLYMRDMTQKQTLQLDAIQGGPESSESPGGALFEAASVDGSKAFFTDTQRLTSDSKALPEKPDLYECEIVGVTCTLHDLTVDHNVPETAAVQGEVLGIDEQGTYLYFVAKGMLAEGARAGANNLYVLHEASPGNWTTTFIGALSKDDENDWGGTGFAIGVDSLNNMTDRVSPNGTYLAFMSDVSLTGYDNTDAAEPKASDEEVFLYNAVTKHTICVSCNPTGARPKGVHDPTANETESLLVDRRKVWGGRYLAGSIPGWTPYALNTSYYQSRYLSEKGRLFFTSPDNLLPAAKNGLEQVYEYEPDGEGSCTNENGCISLISSGNEGAGEAEFLDASASGDDVFLLTATPLLPQDKGEDLDIYDAHVCTAGSPCFTPPTVTPPERPCKELTTCRQAPAPTNVPSFNSPASTTTSGSSPVVGGGSVLSKKEVKTTTKPLTRAQKLAKALKQCRKKHNKHKRQVCEKQARRKYGAKAAKSKASRTRHARTAR